MPIYVKDRETEDAVRSFASRRGLGVTAAIKTMAREAEVREGEVTLAEFERRMAAIKKIQAEISQLPVINPDVDADDWMYDENGLPH